MISILTVAIGLFAVLWLWLRQRPAFVAAFIILFSLAYRMIDIAYLDLFGPVFAIELGRHVGGNDAAPMFVLASLLFIVPLAMIASEKRILKGIDAPPAPAVYLTNLHRGALVVAIGIVGFLYLDMLRIGVIPLFIGMDRLDYNLMSGLLHNRAYELNFLLSASLGMFTILPRLIGGRYSVPFVILFMAVLVYWALTGNRFSALMVTLSYFALPFAAVLTMQNAGILRSQGSNDPWRVLLSAKLLAPLGILAATVTLLGLVINSYYSVRNYADPVYHITQRVLVQPVQTWSTTWDTASKIDQGYNARNADYVIFNPPDTETNPTVRYLMEKELGYFRANKLLDDGQQYAGGFPEIFFELFGFTLALPLMLLLGCAAAWLLYFAVRSLCRGMFMTAFMAVYLYYGFSVAYLGGMLSFVLAPTYAAKFTALVIFFIAEPYFLARGKTRQIARANRPASPSAVPRPVKAPS